MRGGKKLLAFCLLIKAACVEAGLPAAVSTYSSAIYTSAYAMLCAGLYEFAIIVDRIRHERSVPLYFTHNGNMVFADLFCDGADRMSAIKSVFSFRAIFYSEMSSGPVAKPTVLYGNPGKVI